MRKDLRTDPYTYQGAWDAAFIDIRQLEYSWLEDLVWDNRRVFPK